MLIKYLITFDMTKKFFLTHSIHAGKLVDVYLFVVIRFSQNFFNKQKKVQCQEIRQLTDSLRSFRETRGNFIFICIKQ